jgi:hypothetical protein
MVNVPAERSRVSRATRSMRGTRIAVYEQSKCAHNCTGDARGVRAAPAASGRSSIRSHRDKSLLPVSSSAGRPSTGEYVYSPKNENLLQNYISSGARSLDIA